MTTAHRPTWKAAVGKASEGGWNAGGAPSAGLSVLDMPAHTKLKFRTGRQVVDRQNALKESLRKLEEAERDVNKKKLLQRPAVDETIEKEGRLKLLKQTAEIDEKAIQTKYDDADASSSDDDDDDNDDDGGGGWSEDDLDASSDDDDNNNDDNSDDDDDDEDDEAALQAELAKIRAEREAAKRKEEEKKAAAEEEKMEEAALLGNPLLASDNELSSSGRMKRRWNEDVVFRNQAKGEPEVKKRFINDTVRNDFHKRFLNKFIR
ncbi:Cwf15/Cwc15 cell cycle control protein [Nitzschia inconspicua]|uniref:Cwf15/Cwc15 cell cycle control protein n=1 Tax=Nitzschia inconspicua TaxID=303405 RepID=A0A9K3KEW2_9STRA|nr:Cwf15/Cwc15 cell cycle control protein [Nitzschia inconspicua]